MGRLVIVSNRVAVPRRGEAAAAGGLAVALKDAFSGRGGLWFGWSGTVSPEPPDVVRHARRAGVDYAVIDLSQEAYDGFYAGYANSALWEKRQRSRQVNIGIIRGTLQFLLIAIYQTGRGLGYFLRFSGGRVSKAETERS